MADFAKCVLLCMPLWVTKWRPRRHRLSSRVNCNQNSLPATRPHETTEYRPGYREKVEPASNKCHSRLWCRSRLYYCPRNCTLSGITFLLFARFSINYLITHIPGKWTDPPSLIPPHPPAIAPDNKWIYDFQFALLKFYFRFPPNIL